jgi:hypothetical protein
MPILYQDALDKDKRAAEGTEIENIKKFGLS